MGVTPDEVARLAALARIDLSQEEIEDLAPELDVILAAIASVSEVSDPSIPPTSHAVALSNVFRPDDVTGSFPAEAMLAMAPAVEDGRFRVPRILEED